MYYSNSINKGNKMIVVKSRNWYRVSDQSEKGITVIFFDRYEDKLIADKEFETTNTINLIYKDEMVAAMWNLTADDFRSAFAKLTEETGNA